MKKILSIILILVLVVCCGYVVNGDTVENKYIIVVKDFDKIEKQLQQQFLEINAPITFVTNKPKDYKLAVNKKFIDALCVPRTIMSVVAQGTPSEMRNTMYSAIDISKKQNIVIVIFDINNCQAEDAYYAIYDSVDLLQKSGVCLSLFTFEY